MRRHQPRLVGHQPILVRVNRPSGYPACMNEEQGSLSHQRPEDAAAETEDLKSPQPGHPVGQTQPQEGVPEGAHEHPEDIDDTTPDKQSSP